MKVFGGRSQLSLRKTHRYNDGWASEDEWEYLAPMHVLSSRTWDVDYYRNHVWRVKVKLPASMDFTVERALLHYFRWACRCEHDCCGHWRGAAHTAKKVSKYQWVIEGTSSPNI